MNRRRAACVVLLLILIQSAGGLGQVAKSRRAPPPDFKNSTAAKAFFDDIFSVLVGDRPASLGVTPAAVAETSPAENGDDGPTAGGFAWSKLISATTIEDEIKAIKLKVDADVTTPGAFKGSGYQECRRHFSVAAMLFAVAAEFDQNVRWKKNAAVVRDLFARTAANAKVGTNQVYNEAKLRRQDLQDLIGGQEVAGKEAESAASWGNVVDRSPLMERLEECRQGNLLKLTSSAGSFRENSERIFHEAELTAAIGEVLTREGMEDVGDDEYVGFAKRMKQAALEVVEAVKLKNYEQARKSVGDISKSCDECHEAYRG